jgi:hypothetical protein
MIMHHL